jgi:hypothetical protein
MDLNTVLNLKADSRDLVNLLQYLKQFEKDLYADYHNASYDIKPYIDAKISVIEEIIDYVENTLGLKVREAVFDEFISNMSN